MIPLSDWLKGSPASDLPSTDALGRQSDMSHSSLDHVSFDLELALEEARSTARLEAFATIDAKLDAVREQHAVQLAQREKAIDERWSRWCAAGLEGAVNDVLRQLQDAVGSAVGAALVPFLEERVRSRSVDAIRSLLRDTLLSGPEPVLEIRIPAELLGPIAALIEQKEMTVLLTESDRIELVTSAGTSRFESVAEKWIGLLHQEST